MSHWYHNKSYVLTAENLFPYSSCVMWINMYMQFDDFKLYNFVSEKKLWPSCMEINNNEKLFSSSIFYDLLKLLCIGNIWSWFIIHMSAGIFDILLFSLPGQKWSWWTSDGTDSVGRSRSPHGRHWPHESGSSSKYFPEILDSDIDAFVKLNLFELLKSWVFAMHLSLDCKNKCMSTHSHLV